MYDYTEARKTVRALLETFEEAIARSMGLAYVVCRKYPGEYEKLLASAERAHEIVVKPVMAADPDWNRAYAALSDASVNWCEAVNAIRTSQGQEWFGEDARTRMNFMNDLYARFDAAEREAKKRREGDPGIGV